jgi:transposase-like protein
MASIPESCDPVNARAPLETNLDEAVETLCHTISARFNALLVAIASHVVGRSHHVRRRYVPRQLRREGRGCRSGSRRSRRFSRNGFRSRQSLQTKWGEVPIELPRVRYECGGSVKTEWDGLLRPFQRIWTDVDAQIQRWGAMAVSLRQMRKELTHMHIGPLALRTLNERLHQLTTLDPNREDEDVPPILQIDVLWCTILRANDKVRRDRKGRKRPVKGRFKVPIMIAMGIWPDSDRCELISWRLGESESAEEWVKFLGILEAEGICGQNGLKLIIHDGARGSVLPCRPSGLMPGSSDASSTSFGTSTMRFIRRTTFPTSNGGDTAKRSSGNSEIWQARRCKTMLRRYHKVVCAYRDSQPEAVGTLRRDFRMTVTYYALEQEFPRWERKYLCTTSRLERFNRRIRRRIRAANAYHSDTWIEAMLIQEVRGVHDAQRAR